jgi:KDO2-lipid IV(A) lauroyltransferase
LKTEVRPEARHAPERGRVARLLGPFHVTGVFWYRFHLFGTRIAPFWIRRPGVFVFTCFFFVVLRKIGAVIASNLVPVLGRCGWTETQRRVFRTMHQYAWCLTERYERFVSEDRFRFEIEKMEIWNRLDAAKRGFILVTGHVGNWEAGSMVPSSVEGRRVHVVREEELDPEAQRMIRDLVGERLGGLYETHFASDDPRLGIALLEALEEGSIVALQGDRPRKGGRTLAAKVFGRPYDLPEGPVALARLADVPLLPVFVLREGRFRYRIVFREPIRVPRTSDRRDDMASAAAELATAIEWGIRESPHQWFCFSRVWD